MIDPRDSTAEQPVQNDIKESVKNEAGLLYVVRENQLYSIKKTEHE